MAYSDRELLARIVQCEAGGEGDNRNESSCNGSLMANYSPQYGKALQIVEKVQMMDSEEISKIFKKIIEKGIQTELIIINVPKGIVKSKLIENMEINDFIDQFIYYRNLRGYTLDEVGHAIGISGKYYWKYENRVHKLTNIDRIHKIAEFLGIQDKLLIE